jgi:uncharacterized membrane protein YvbJ
MFCSKCGTQLLEDSLFCNKCGNKIVENINNKPNDISMPVESLEPTNNKEILVKCEKCGVGNGNYLTALGLLCESCYNESLIQVKNGEKIECSNCGKLICEKDYFASGKNDKALCVRCFNKSIGGLRENSNNTSTPNTITEKNNNRKANFKIAGVVIIIALLIFGCIFCFTQLNGNARAWRAATNAVQSELKSPSTASFPKYNDSYVVDNGDGTYTVSSYVDAENSFGAEIRSDWSCTVDSNKNVSNIVIDGD